MITAGNTVFRTRGFGMIPEDILSTAPLPERFASQAAAMLLEGETPLFTIVGDLDLKGRYNESALVVTDRRTLAFDQYHAGGVYVAEHAQVDKAFVKRMYGNAVLRVALRGEAPRDIFRFTYSVASLCDAAALFAENIAGGGDVRQEFDIVKATFDKKKSFCPKCGRALGQQGAACISCTSKSTLVRKFAKYVRPQLKLMVLCLALSLVTTAMALAPPYVTKTLVDTVIPNKDLNALLMLVAILLSVYIVQYTIGAVRGYFMRIAGDRIVAGLRNDIYEKAQYLPLSFYDKTSTGSVISRVSGDTSTLQAFMLRITQEAIIQFFLMIGIIVIMFLMNWKLTLLSLTPIPLVVLGARYFGKRIAPVYRKIWRRWAAVSSILTDTLPGVRVIKSFTGEQRSAEKFESYNNEWLIEDRKAAKLSNIFPSAVTFFVTCGSLLIWGFGGKWVIQSPQNISVGMLVSFISYAAMFYGPVNFFATLNDTYQNSLTSAQRILDVIDAEPEADFGKGNLVKKVKGKIEFRNVNFSFDRIKKALTNINLVIEPGDIVGIVGTTGSGKSTLVNLIMRFYDAYEGEILVDGVNIKELDLESYRSKIGYVQQEPIMFKDTVFRNIAFSLPDADVEQVIHAADVANAHSFIARLPDGYDTMLGERGVGLSGGERQRLSIARAVLKNPSLLIFDEATAAVDSETEHLIQQAIERLISGRTTLMIAHRLSTLRKANKIVVVDKGEIVEFGSHDELMALKGKYFKLIEIQSMSEKIRAGKEAERFE